MGVRHSFLFVIDLIDMTELYDTCEILASSSESVFLRILNLLSGTSNVSVRLLFSLGLIPMIIVLSFLFTFDHLFSGILCSVPDHEKQMHQ